MRILALDPAEYKLGWALGESGRMPTVGVLKLRTEDERSEEAIGRFAMWLNERLVGVELLVVEHYLPSGALRGKTTAATREGAIGLAYTARAVAAISHVAFRSPQPSTVRAHFIGQANAGDRASTKAAVIKQAQLLGYIPKTCFEGDDMADACALYDFASSYFARRPAAFMLA